MTTKRKTKEVIHTEPLPPHPRALSAEHFNQLHIISKMAMEALRASDESFAIQCFESLKKLGEGLSWQFHDPLVVSATQRLRGTQMLDGLTETVPVGPSLLSLVASKVPTTHHDLHQTPTIKALSKLGAQWNEIAPYGKSPLMTAVEASNWSVANAIHEHGGHWLGSFSSDQMFKDPIHSPIAHLLFNQKNIASELVSSGTGDWNYEEGQNISRSQIAKAKEAAWLQLEQEMTAGKADPAVWLAHIGAYIVSGSVLMQNASTPESHQLFKDDWAKFLNLTKKLKVNPFAVPLEPTTTRESYLNLLGVGQVKNPTLSLALLTSLQSNQDSAITVASQLTLLKDALKLGPTLFTRDPRSSWGTFEALGFIHESSSEKGRLDWLNQSAMLMNLSLGDNWRDRQKAVEPLTHGKEDWPADVNIAKTASFGVIHSTALGLAMGFPGESTYNLNNIADDFQGGASNGDFEARKSISKANLGKIKSQTKKVSELCSFLKIDSSNDHWSSDLQKWAEAFELSAKENARIFLREVQVGDEDCRTDGINEWLMNFERSLVRLNEFEALGPTEALLTEKAMLCTLSTLHNLFLPAGNKKQDQEYGPEAWLKVSNEVLSIKWKNASISEWLAKKCQEVIKSGKAKHDFEGYEKLQMISEKAALEAIPMTVKKKAPAKSL